MRIPFPERIPLFYAFIFAFLLGGVELIQGTALYFACGVMGFIILTTLAFNTAGGFSRPSGAYVFFNATLTLILGVIYKTWLGEPGESNLRIPQLTILLYNVSMLTMFAATYVSRRFSRREGLLQNSLPLNRLQGAVYGCTGLGLATYLANGLISHSNGSFLSAFDQLDRFMLMAILLGVTHQIRKTGGRSFMSFPVFFSVAWYTITGGLLGFSKESFLAPSVAMLLTAAALGYRFSWPQIAAIVFSMFFFVHYLVPYSQYGRPFMTYDTTYSQKISRAVDLLSHPDEIRAGYLQAENDKFNVVTIHFYDTPQGFWDRAQMVAVDDALIDYTENHQTFGYLPIIFGMENIAPHFIWKNKPSYVWGNLYAHELGMLSPDDTTTSVSFSAVGEAWHLGRWTCLTLVCFVLWSIFFLTFDSLGGDVRKSPWGLLAIVIFMHQAAEGGINAMLYELFYGVAALLTVAFFSARIVPYLGALIIGPARMNVSHGPAVGSIPRRDNLT